MTVTPENAINPKLKMAQEAARNYFDFGPAALIRALDIRDDLVCKRPGIKARGEWFIASEVRANQEHEDSWSRMLLGRLQAMGVIDENFKPRDEYVKEYNRL